MGLKKLTEERARNMLRDQNHKIYLVDESETYLEELFEKYDLADRLTGVLVDTDNRVSREEEIKKSFLSIRGRELPVYPYERFPQLDPDGYFIILNDYFKEAYEKLLSHQNEKARDRFRVYYFCSYETETELSYREKYKDTPLEDLIVFRSGPHASSYVRGMDFSDNARALFEYMLAERFNETYELVWLVKNPSDFRHIEEKYNNVTFLSFGWSVSEVPEERDQYYRALCLARYLFMTDAYGFARNARKDQIRVQLWHGCGFKTRVNFVRCEKRYEYTTVISRLYSKIHQDIYGLREDQVLVTGYAKEDWLFHPVREAWEILSVPRADRYLFWLPTFRVARTGLTQLNEYEMEGQTGLPIVDTFEKLEELDRLLGELNTILVVKLHPFQDRSRIGRIGMKHIILLDNEMLVDQDIQINQLLGLADGLISDYSSAAVDYMLLDRPIGFTLEDVEEYGESRGFVFDNIKDWLPGAELYSFRDLCLFVREVGQGVDSTREKRGRLRKIMHDFDDDQSCRRITEALEIHI